MVSQPVVGPVIPGLVQRGSVPEVASTLPSKRAPERSSSSRKLCAQRWTSKPNTRARSASIRMPCSVVLIESARWTASPMPSTSQGLTSKAPRSGPASPVGPGIRRRRSLQEIRAAAAMRKRSSARRGRRGSRSNRRREAPRAARSAMVAPEEHRGRERECEGSSRSSLRQLLSHHRRHQAEPVIVYPDSIACLVLLPFHRLEANLVEKVVEQRPQHLVGKSFLVALQLLATVRNRHHG